MFTLATLFWLITGLIVTLIILSPIIAYFTLAELDNMRVLKLMEDGLPSKQSIYKN